MIRKVKKQSICKKCTFKKICSYTKEYKEQGINVTVIHCTRFKK